MLPPPGFQARSQESRFHNSFDSASTNQLDLHQVNISVGQKPLLVDSHVQFLTGGRYGLIGRNGVGKSILLKSIAYRWLPGVPKEISVCYVEQVNPTAEDKTTVMECLMRADSEQAQIRDDIEALESQIQSNDVLYKILLKRLEIEIYDMQQVCSVTSGARGNDARQKLLQLEHQLENWRAAGEWKSELMPDLSTTLTRLYAERKEAPDLLKVRCQQVLESLRFKPNMWQQPISTLSGGWRMRVAMARALVTEAQLLLCDEPTNHLDLPGILWLTRYLTEELPQEMTLVIVSHDRHFLDATVNKIVVMQAQSLKYYQGNYTVYKEAQEEAKEHRTKLRDAADRKEARIQQNMQQGMQQARRAEDDKRIAQLASRMKKHEERRGMERNAKGHRFRLNKDRIGKFLTLREEIQDEYVDPAVHWTLPEPLPLRSHGALLEVDSIAFRFQSQSQFLFKGITLCIEPGARLAIIGSNAQGKTTLMHVLTGKLAPSQGSIVRHPQAKWGYFEQDFVDQTQLLSQSALMYLNEKYPQLEEQELYAALGSFGLQGALARQPLKTLSGGQVVRFAFACMLMEEPHALFLDEPTNHLDLDAIEALIEALQNYSGAVILVSHDIYFVQKLVQDSEQGRILVLKRGSLNPIANMEEYISND